jgi:hypothetical protein
MTFQFSLMTTMTGFAGNICVCERKKMCQVYIDSKDEELVLQFVNWNVIDCVGNWNFVFISLRRAVSWGEHVVLFPHTWRTEPIHVLYIEPEKFHSQNFSHKLNMKSAVQRQASYHLRHSESELNLRFPFPSQNSIQYCDLWLSQRTITESQLCLCNITESCCNQQNY